MQISNSILRFPLTIIALTLALVAPLSAGAYDFKSGGLCYNINSDGKSVTVTYENENAPRYTNLNGALNLPTSVKNGGKTYSVTTIGNNAFAGCTGITSLNIPNSITAVGDYAFRDCEGIATVTVGNSARSWGDYVFLYCSGLTTINWNVPDGVSFTIGGGTGLLPYGNPFYQAYNIKTVVFGNNVKRIPSCFCRNFSNLTSVTIPSSVTNIGTWAFAYCKSLQKVTIPAAVDSIGYEAFRGCENLATLTIPTSLTYIGNGAFYGTAWFNNQPDGVVYAGNMAYGYKGTMPANTSITLKDNCIGLACKAFASQTNLKSITLNKNIKYFNWNGSTFDGCTGLTTVNWNVESCDDFTSGTTPFKGLTGITNFNFGNSVKYIPAFLCYGLSGITAVNIPKSVTEVGNDAFYNCYGMTRVNISDLAAFCNINFRSTSSSPVLYGNNLYLNGTLVTNLVIPSTVTSVNGYAFRKCTSITELTIPKSVTTVGNYAFELCSGLKKVTWNVTAGNDYQQSFYSPFHGLSGINTFIFGNNVMRIPAYLCYDITGMTQVAIPSSVTEIGRGAFGYNNGLTRVDISDLTAWLNIDFLSNTSNPLYCGKNLYLGDNKVTYLAIPSDVNAIKKFAFYCCESITSASIPASVSTIDNTAFSNCANLSTVVSRIDTPQNITYGTNVFKGIPAASTLYVPFATADDYSLAQYGETANPWLAFGHVTEWSDGDVNLDGAVSVGDVSAIYAFIINGEGNAALCDLNNDGAVNMSDVSALYSIILGNN